MSFTFAMRNGDWIMQPDGQPKTIEGYDKIQQDIHHSLVHPYDPVEDYGNELTSNDVLVLERAAVPGVLQRDVSDAIVRLKRKQTLTPRRHLPDNERIEKIRSIRVTQIDNVSWGFIVVVSVRDRSADDVRKVFRIQNKHKLSTGR